MRGHRASAAAALEVGLDINDGAVPGRHGQIPIRTYRAPRTSTDGEPRTLVWVHGGAFSHGGLDQLESHATAAALAQTGVEVVAVDYRRVPPWSPFRDPPPGPLPGIRYPVPLDDVEDVFLATQASHHCVALGGASAGACLSLAASLRLSRSRTRAPDRLLLAYGTFHAALPALPVEVRARVRGRRGVIQFRTKTVDRMNRNYAGPALAEPFAFPGGHDLVGVPPAFIMDADHDTLRASGQALRAELERAGIEVRYRVLNGSTHGFLQRPGTAPFEEFVATAATWLLQ